MRSLRVSRRARLGERVRAESTQVARNPADAESSAPSREVALCSERPQRRAEVAADDRDEVDGAHREGATTACR